MALCRLLGAFLLLAFQATAHSWNEQFQLISNSGSYVGNYGYPRGYVDRGDPSFTGTSMNYLLPTTGTRITSDDLLCHPAQRTSNYTNPNYPRLRATAGNRVAMKYLENGHVSFPKNQIGKPAEGGTVFVFGTTQPKDDEKITDVLQWTQDGSGGDGRGQLLTAQNFDDGRCHQIAPASPISVQRQIEFPNKVGDNQAELWCETDLQIPKNVSAGTYSIYWIWQWPTAAGVDPGLPNGKDEYYTTCSDFDIVETLEASSSQKMKYKALQQDPMPSAVSDFKDRTALTESPELSDIATPTASKTAGGNSPHKTSRPTKATGIVIPTLSARPGETPAPNKGHQSMIVVTVTQRLTVTAAEVVTEYVTASPSNLRIRGDRWFRE